MDMHVSVILHSWRGIENAACYGRKWGRFLSKSGLTSWQVVAEAKEDKLLFCFAGWTELVMSQERAVERER